MVIAASLLKGERFGQRDLFPPAGNEPGIGIYVVDHTYHAGIVIPVDKFRQLGKSISNILLSRQDQSDWLEIGWGDKGFYSAGTFSEITLATTARAVLMPSPSVLHVVKFNGRPEKAFYRSKLVYLKVSPKGLRNIIRGISKTVGAIENAPFVPGLYGNSRFYPAKPSYHLFNICNHWVAELLASAGIQINVTLASWPGLMRADLILHAGGIGLN